MALGNKKFSISPEKTKFSHYYLIIFAVEKDGYRHYKHIYVNVSGKGLKIAIDKATKIATEYADNNYNDYNLRLLRWEKYHHRPRAMNTVVKNPVLRVK
mgnify:CR=1 FL=1